MVQRVRMEVVTLSHVRLMQDKIYHKPVLRRQSSATINL